MFTFDFTIWVKAYDQVEKIENNKTVIDWVDGGEIELSPTKTGGVGKHGRVRNIGSFLYERPLFIQDRNSVNIASESNVSCVWCTKQFYRKLHVFTDSICYFNVLTNCMLGLPVISFFRQFLYTTHVN